jgi:hypothetical protein
MSDFSVVLTTINPPTDDVKFIVNNTDATVFVVGDKKTPVDWDYGRSVYVSYARQHELFPALAELIPANHYARKNLGYLIAARGEGDWIYETDDDNRPYLEKFAPPISLGFSVIQNGGWVNVMQEFKFDDAPGIWPRGFPLEKIASEYKSSFTTDVLHQPVVMGLVDQDPDVDAIYRLTRPLPYFFKNDDKTVTLGGGSYFPWNSQNTWWRKNCLPLMYLPVTVTPRVTDILRSYVATVILQKFDLGVGITSPSAIQERNQHNLLKDFGDEMPLYLHAQQMLDCIIEGVEDSENFYTAMYDAYENLADYYFVERSEIGVLLCYLAETQKIQGAEILKI